MTLSSLILRDRVRSALFLLGVSEIEPPILATTGIKTNSSKPSLVIPSDPSLHLSMLVQLCIFSLRVILGRLVTNGGWNLTRRPMFALIRNIWRTLGILMVGTRKVSISTNHEASIFHRLSNYALSRIQTKEEYHHNAHSVLARSTELSSDWIYRLSLLIAHWSVKAANSCSLFRSCYGQERRDGEYLGDRVKEFFTKGTTA